MKMKKMLWAILPLFLAGCTSDERPLLRLEKVETTQDQQKCADQGGMGALVFRLDADGKVGSAPAAGCLIPADQKIW